jgi:hypothetical protein
MHALEHHDRFQHRSPIAFPNQNIDPRTARQSSRFGPLDHCKHNNKHSTSWKILAEMGCQLESVHPWQPHLQKHNVGVLNSRQSQRDNPIEYDLVAAGNALHGLNNRIDAIRRGIRKKYPNLLA